MDRQYLQIGKAVPVPLGAAIGKAVLAAEDGPRPDQDDLDLEHALELAAQRLRASARNKRPVKQDNQPTLV